MLFVLGGSGFMQLKGDFVQCFRFCEGRVNKWVEARSNEYAICARIEDAPALFSV